VLDGTDEPGFRRREEDVEVAGTHFGGLMAFFFACSAHGQVTSRVGEVLQVPDGRMGREFDVWGMRRRGRRAPIFTCP
jgi:hypothetical protein